MPTLVGFGRATAKQWIVKCTYPVLLERSHPSDWEMPGHSRTLILLVQPGCCPFATGQTSSPGIVEVAGSGRVYKLISMLLLDVVQRIFCVDHLVDEYDNLLLCACIEEKYVHWHRFAFSIRGNRFLLCNLLHCHTGNNLQAGLTVRGVMDMTVQGHRLRVPDVVPSVHQLTYCTTKMFRAENMIWIRDCFEALKTQWRSPYRPSS